MFLQIEIDDAKCIKCGDCVDICPVGAIILSGGHISITDKCVLCLACVSDCEQCALTVKK